MQRLDLGGGIGATDDVFVPDIVRPMTSTSEIFKEEKTRPQLVHQNLN